LAQALEQYRVAVTNKVTAVPQHAVSQAEAGAAREALEAALEEQGILDTAKARAVPTSGETGPGQVTSSAASSLGMGDYYTNMQRVVPGLYIGSYHPATNLAQLDAEGITHICCCISSPARFPDKHKVCRTPQPRRGCAPSPREYAF
jgi:hypothetical protein